MDMISTVNKNSLIPEVPAKKVEQKPAEESTESKSTQALEDTASISPEAKALAAKAEK